jgi:hypothetical protein
MTVLSTRYFMPLTILCWTYALPATLAAGQPAVPDYEVKLFLDAGKVLKADRRPSRDLQQVFDLSGSSTEIRMQFLDGAGLPLHRDGWNVRLRRREGRDDVELSYKRRYRIEAGDIDGALAEAARDGFDADEGDYEAQVEWGFSRQTLTFTRQHTLDAPGGGGLRLPGRSKSTAIAAEKIPGKLDRVGREGWARTILADARLFGPVTGRRYHGKWEGTEVDLEVWTIPGAGQDDEQTIVEISFKEADRGKAEAGKRRLESSLRDRGWLLPRDVLKTEMILERDQ